MQRGLIEKLEKCSDKYFVSPIVITVKKDGSVEFALESRKLNKQVHKNKYQMPNIEELMDTVGQTISPTGVYRNAVVPRCIHDTRSVCEASHNGLSAVLEQLSSDGWRPISFASRYLNDAEKKYSTKELEMLAVVWGRNTSEIRSWGKIFMIVTDHKALVSLLNRNNKKNNTMFSRLTRWLDRLIPFDFQVEHKPAAKIGFADYLSRHPSSDAKPVSTFDSMLTVAKISLIRSALGFQKENFSKGKLESTKPNHNKRVL